MTEISVWSFLLPKFPSGASDMVYWLFADVTLASVQSLQKGILLCFNSGVRKFP